MYSVKHLQYLTALGELGSFSKAADACNVTQSTLSLGIQELERQMALTLFERSRKNIIPTPAGKKAIIHARDILNMQRNFTADMQSMTNPNAGPLKLGAIPTIAPYFLPEFLPKLEKTFPKSSIQVSEDTTEVILKKIQRGEMDLGILAFPMNIGDLEHKILFAEDFHLAHPKNIAFKSNITVDGLSHHDLLLLRDGHCMKDHVLSACNMPQVRKNQFFEADSLHTLLAMVNQGYGLTFLPDMAVNAGMVNAYLNVETRSFTGDIPTREIGLVWRRTDVRRGSYLNI
jgi:LysR family hydrogen peroxide-inducible transcriptional activator